MMCLLVPRWVQLCIKEGVLIEQKQVSHAPSTLQFLLATSPSRRVPVSRWSNPNSEILSPSLGDST